MKTKKINPNFKKILDLLSDGNQHSGEQLAERLGVSRTAIWKHMQHLRVLDVPLHVESGGYRLEQPYHLLDKDAIAKSLDKPVKHIHLFESVTSTNEYLMKHGTSSPEICLAEQQTAGRGRLGRAWHSPFGQNIYLSLRYEFSWDGSMLSGLSLVIGAVLASILHNVFDLKPQLKWPNDIYIDHKKLAGILIQLQTEANGNTTAIIGVGLNANMLPNDAVPEAISLQTTLGNAINRTPLVVLMINSMMNALETFGEKGFVAFQELWSSYDMLFQKEVEVVMGKEVKKGISRGIDVHGYFMLETDQGIHTISAGDVTRCR